MPARWFTTVAALVTMAVQLTLPVAGGIAACGTARHTHNGRPAPDCPMHHAQPVAEPHASGHQHHHAGMPDDPDAARLTCGCSASLPAFLIASPGVISEPISISRPMTTSLTASQQPTTPREQSSTPLTPPPRTLIA